MIARPIALVTGASSGIGEAFAEELASRGWDLVLTARRESKLTQIANRLSNAYGTRIEVITCDLADRVATGALCDALRYRGLAVHVLVNCAGFGVPGGFVDSEDQVYADMVQVMAWAPTQLTTFVLPEMIARRSGLIVNVASLAGIEDMGAGAVYGATKAFLISFSKSLAREVAKYGVTVTAVCPGLTRTEFHAAPEMRRTVVGMPEWMWMEPSTVARQGLDAALAGRSLVINGRLNRLFVEAVRYVPRPVLAAVGRLGASVYVRVRGRLR
jgi:hypothetical protein